MRYRQLNQAARGFTLAELAVIVLVIAVLVAVLLPALGRARREARSMQSSTQVRGIVQGMINYAPGNNDLYPGIRKVAGSIVEDTTPLPVSNVAYGTDRTGYDPAFRFAVLLRNNYFSPEYAMNPAETNRAKAPIRLADKTNINSNYFSFAMLRIDDGAGTGRRNEWRATTNSKAVAVSDRNLAAQAGRQATSIFVASNSSWRGSVAYNDNHCVFEISNIVSTAYDVDPPEGQPVGAVKADDLFADDADSLGRAGYDAGMVYQDPYSYVNQR